MFERLPGFVALESLTLWVRPQCFAEHFINGLKGAPNLTKLVFQLVLYKEDEEGDRKEFDAILHDLLPWQASESMKTVLTRKFPRCQRIGFHFCIPRDSEMHFRRGLRRRMERRLKDRLKETGAGITEFLEVEWLDEKYNPVTYSKTNGKPPWKIQNRAHWYREPETEASDCESEKSNHDDSDEYDSDGNIIIREWTEAHERSYIRVMAECGMYPDGEGGWKHESF